MKRGTPDHPKVAMLAVKLDVPLYAAVGILEMLWHFTAEFCPRGNVGKFPDKSICAGIKWGKSRINLIQVLLECGFLEAHSEHRLIVHDWQDHADQAVRRKLERAHEQFVTSQQLVAVKPLTSTSLPEPMPKPEPMPEPQPSQPSTPPPQPSPSDPKPSSNGTRNPALGQWTLDETYAPLVDLYRNSGKPVIDDDFAEGWWPWKNLDIGQKQIRIDRMRANLESQLYDDPNFIPGVRKFIEREYKRELRAPVRRETMSDEVTRLVAARKMR